MDEMSENFLWLKKRALFPRAEKKNRKIFDEIFFINEQTYARKKT